MFLDSYNGPYINSELFINSVLVLFRPLKTYWKFIYFSQTLRPPEVPSIVFLLILFTCHLPRLVTGGTLQGSTPTCDYL